MLAHLLRCSQVFFFFEEMHVGNRVKERVWREQQEVCSYVIASMDLLGVEVDAIGSM